ncbi:MAG: hypothetical protein HWE27_12190 [Gammaproteobacteria bacterium]|nr:hypothetical protein [Gammaproteobacteria bacterium]
MSDDFLIEIPFSTKPKTFQNEKECEEFFQSEEGKWDWVNLMHNTKFGTVSKPLVSHIKHNIFNKIHNYLSDEVNVEEKKSNINKLLRENKFPLSISPLGNFILEQSKLDEDIALWMLLLTVIPPENNNYPRNNNPYRQIWTNFSDNAKQHLPTILKANEYISIINTLNHDEPTSIILGKITQYSDEARDKVDKIESLLQDVNSLKKSKENLWDKFETDAYNNLLKKYRSYRLKDKCYNNKLLQRSKAELQEAREITKNAKDTYKSQVELDSSVKYWEKKEERHKKSSRWWLGGVIIASILLFLSPAIAKGYIDLLFKEKIETTIMGVSVNPLELSSIIILISIFSFFIRIFSKHYSAHSHLRMEADERQTMIKTYLAFMLEGKLKEEEDRRLALEVLFRTSQTGIVADYGHITPTESVVKILQKNQPIASKGS